MMNFANTLSQYPTIEVETQLSSNTCKRDSNCFSMKTEMEQKLLGRYIGLNEPIENQIVAAVLDVQQFDFQAYINNFKKKYKGNAFRDAKKATNKGFYCKPFPKELFLPDIVEINHSKEIRCGRPMTAPYRMTLEEMGGAPKEHLQFQVPTCPHHYEIWWGVFEKIDGYKQGDIVTNEKLLGYILFKRNGSYALYAKILGHGDYLRYGIMYKLHLSILEWISTEKNLVTDLKTLMYGGYFSGKQGLQLWKKKTLFEPGYLVYPSR